MTAVLTDRSRRILATDLDRTLLPNGEWPADNHAIALFNQLTVAHDVRVIYVTGRNTALTEAAIQEYGIRYPDILCTDVGTRISHYEDGLWREDADWSLHLQRSSPRWAPGRVREALADMPGLCEQEAEHNNSFKLSYYVDPDCWNAIEAEVNNRVLGQFDASMIFSFDPHRQRGLLDLLPQHASKRGALSYLANGFGQSRDRLVFCGDSGNDIDALTAGFAGVMVRNADPQLRAAVQAAMKADSALRVYEAKGGYRGLNGYYAGGVIEGAVHYGLFPPES